MEFLDLKKENAELANILFTESVQEKEILYKPFESDEEFFEFFGQSREKNVCKISILEESGIAFASGCYVEGEERAYITFLAVKKEYRRKGIAAAMLKRLEARLLEKEGVNRIEIIFFNPMAFSWTVPNTENADHPNAPGIDVSSEAYLFFKNCGYRDYAIQNSYYIDLSKYHIPDFLEEKEKKLKEENITFEIYREDKHHGIEALLEKLKNPVWERDIQKEIQKGEKGRPIIIVSHNGKVIGFTGPLDVEKSKRGYFAGIGVDDNYRGKGIAKVLFCKLCVGLKEKNAEFMTLFTGETNLARNIYEAAGFKIVRTWADMRKE